MWHAATARVLMYYNSKTRLFSDDRAWIGILVLPLALCQLWCYNEVFEEEIYLENQNHSAGFGRILIYCFHEILSEIVFEAPLEYPL